MSSSIIPIFSNPCDLAQRIPALIADFLDLETSLHRRFREESISDVLVASFVRLGTAEVIVALPKNAAVTGNDFDITIVDPIAFEAVQYRLQAKRLTPHESDWRKGSYKELAHPHGTGAQSASLIRSAAAEKRIQTIPLYAFYNPTRTCLASGGLVSGIEMADGRAVRLLVQALIAAKPKRLPLKRITTISPLFFPLTCLFCTDPASPDETQLISSAAASRARVVRALEQAGEKFFAENEKRQRIEQHGEIGRRQLNDLRLSGERARSKALSLDENIPSFLRAALERRGAQPSERIIYQKINKPKVIIFA